MLPFFRKVKTQNRELEQLQQACSQQFQVIRNCSMVDGVMVSVSVQTGENIISNPLNREAQGWIVTDKDAACDVYRVSWNARLITLNASAPATLKLWVF